MVGYYLEQRSNQPFVCHFVFSYCAKFLRFKQVNISLKIAKIKCFLNCKVWRLNLIIVWPFPAVSLRTQYLLCSLQNLTLVESLVSLIYEVPDLSMLPRFEIPFESFERYCYKPTFLLWRIDSFCKKFLLVSTRAWVEGSEELKAVANHRHNLLPLKNIKKKHHKSLILLTNWSGLLAYKVLHIDVWDR